MAQIKVMKASALYNFNSLIKNLFYSVPKFCFLGTYTYMNDSRYEKSQEITCEIKSLSTPLSDTGCVPGAEEQVRDHGQHDREIFN